MLPKEAFEPEYQQGSGGMTFSVYYDTVNPEELKRRRLEIYIPSHYSDKDVLKRAKETLIEARKNRRKNVKKKGKKKR